MADHWLLLLLSVLSNVGIKVAESYLTRILCLFTHHCMDGSCNHGDKHCHDSHYGSCWKFAIVVAIVQMSTVNFKYS